MKETFFVFAIVCLCFLAGCYKPHDERINLSEDVRSDTIDSNVLTRLFSKPFSWLAGDGIQITEVTERRTPEGFRELQVRGYNKSYNTARFQYRVEWLDADGMVIPSKTSVWMPVSARPKSEFTFRVTAPRADADEFRVNTRK